MGRAVATPGRVAEVEASLPGAAFCPLRPEPPWGAPPNFATVRGTADGVKPIARRPKMARAGHREWGWVRVLSAALVLGCGPSVSENDSAGGSGSAATEADSDSATSEASTSDGDGSSGGTEAGCARSDLPPPFCHVAVVTPHTSEPYVVPSDSPMTVALARLSPTQIERFDLTTQEWSVTPVEPSELDAAPLPQPKVLFGYLDGDGAPELVLPTRYDVIPAYRLPSLDPLPVIPYDESASDPWDETGKRSPLYTLDIDLDGRDELLAHSGPGHFEIWSLDGTWSQVGILEVYRCHSDWGVHADVDLDGHLDLVLFGGDNCGARPTEYDPTIDIVTVLHARAGAAVPEITTVPAGIRGQSIHLGDFDGDGRDDLLVEGQRFDLALVRGRPGGGFMEGARLNVAPDDEGEGLYTPAAGDFDGDGVWEILVPHRFSGDRLGRVIGDTVELVPFEISTSRYASAEINGDGVTDLLASGTIYVSAR